ncbi:importin subunit alpha-1b-like [Nicotiana sylvestris]
MKFSVILRFAQFIKMPYVPQQLKDDSAWILVLIFSLDLAQIFDMDEYELVVEVVVKLLDFPDESLPDEKALLVVGQIAAGDCDCLLDHGALTPLLNKSKEANNNFPMQREATRILSKIFKSKLDLPSEQVISAVYSLLELLRSNDDEVLTNVCYALSYCIDGIYGIIQHHDNFSLIYDRLVGLLRHESCSVIIPVLKIVVGIVEREASWYCKFNPADLGCLVTLLDNHNEDGDVVNDICSIICGVVSCGNMEVLGGYLLHRGSV